MGKRVLRTLNQKNEPDKCRPIEKPGHVRDSTQTENNPPFRGIIGRHFHLHLVSNDKTDEAFPHLTGDMGKDFVAAGEFNLKHGACENGRDCSFNLN